MIRSIEFKEMARKLGVPESTIERDYAQNWFLKTITDHDDSIILKGGTGIRKMYIRDYRFSDDLDFTLLENRSIEDFKSLLIAAISDAKDLTGIDFSDEFILKTDITGYLGIVYFRILRKTGHPLRIKLDLTIPKNEKIMVYPISRPLIHTFSDDFDASIRVYTLEEIVAEKLRALFQRTRPRDLYDICSLWKIVDHYKVSEIFREKCKFKGIEPIKSSFTGRRDDFSGSWKNSLVHQLKDIPDFDEMYKMTYKIVTGLIE